MEDLPPGGASTLLLFLAPMPEWSSVEVDAMARAGGLAAGGGHPAPPANRFPRPLPAASCSQPFVQKEPQSLSQRWFYIFDFYFYATRYVLMFATWSRSAGVSYVADAHATVRLQRYDSAHKVGPNPALRASPDH
jgi:hypothetical protein